MVKGNDNISAAQSLQIWLTRTVVYYRLPDCSRERGTGWQPVLLRSTSCEGCGTVGQSFALIGLSLYK